MWIKYGKVVIFPCKTESLTSEPVYEDTGVDIISYKHTITVTGYINMSMLSIIEDKILVGSKSDSYYGQGQSSSSNIFAKDNTPVDTLSISREQDFSFHQTISAICRYLLTPRRRLFIGATSPPQNVVLMADDALYRHRDIIFASPETAENFIIDNYGGPIPTRAVIDSIVHNNFAKVHWTCTWYSDPRRYRPGGQKGSDFNAVNNAVVNDPISSNRYSVDISTNEHGLTQISITTSLTLNPGYYIDQRVYHDFDVTQHMSAIPVYVFLRVNMPNMPLFRRTSSHINVSMDGRKATITTTLVEVPYVYMHQDKFGINHIDVNVRAVSQLPVESSSSTLIDLEVTYRAYIAPYAHPHDVCWFLYRILNHGLMLLSSRLKQLVISDIRRHLPAGANNDMEAFYNKCQNKWQPKLLLRSTSFDYDYSGLTATLRANINIFDIAITMILYKGGHALFSRKDESMLRLLLGQTLVYTAIQLLKSTMHDIKEFNYDKSFGNDLKNTASSFEQSHFLVNRKSIVDDFQGAWTNEHPTSQDTTGYVFSSVPGTIDYSELKRQSLNTTTGRFSNSFIQPIGTHLLVFICPISYHNISDYTPERDDVNARTMIPPLKRRSVIII